MPTTIAQRLLRVDEYVRMIEVGILGEDDRVELLAGKLIEMSPSGTRHAATVKWLNQFFTELLGNKVLMSIQDPIELGKHSLPEPDVALLRPTDNFYVDTYPRAADCLLVIEVADSSYDKDREVKTQLYAEAGIPEYWLVNLNTDQLEVFRQPEKGLYQEQLILRGEEEVVLSDLDLRLPAKNIFVPQA